EVRLAVATRRRRLARAVPGPKALHRRPRLQQSPVDGKMLRAQKPLHLRQGEQRRKKPLRDLLSEKAVAVLGECRGVENLLVDRQPDEPAKQQIELQPFDQLPLRADRIEKLQQRGPQQPLRRNGRTSAGLVKRRKRPVEIRQRRVARKTPSLPARRSPPPCPRASSWSARRYAG